VSAGAEAADEDSALSARFGHISLRPGAGEDPTSSGGSLTMCQESQTDLLSPHVPSCVDAGVQCSPATVDKDTMITDCSVVRLITFVVMVVCLSVSGNTAEVVSECLQCLDTRACLDHLTK